MQQEINSVDEAILDCNKNTVEWGNNIRQIGWDIFDKLEDRISDITDEADFLVDLMSSEKMYDDKNGGTITDYGKATLGLHGVKYNTYMQQADEYRQEMEKLQEALNADPHAVKFLSGSYYYSSDGQTPTGDEMHGQVKQMNLFKRGIVALKQDLMRSNKNSFGHLIMKKFRNITEQTIDTSKKKDIDSYVRDEQRVHVQRNL